MTKVDEILCLILLIVACAMSAALIVYAGKCEDRGGELVHYSCIDKKAILK